MIFFEINVFLRIDVLFNVLEDDDYYKGLLFFVELNVGMVLQFFFDYMYLVCLGVVKCMFLLWKKDFLRCWLGL